MQLVRGEGNNTIVNLDGKTSKLFRNGQHLKCFLRWEYRQGAQEPPKISLSYVSLSPPPLLQG